MRNRLVLIGETNAQRLVVVVLENRGGGNYYPVTAYDTSHEDKAFQERLRGGEKDETESRIPNLNHEKKKPTGGERII
jgi:hypothetical protein